MSETNRRPSGSPPYWPAGTPIMWREGSGPLGTGAPVVDISAPHFAQPVTVVRDDADALVVWLPISTPVLRAARADGLGKRDDPSTLFTTEVVQDRGVHADFDQLRVAPTGRPWSVWLFFTEGTGEFAGWYVNLEKPHVRDQQTVYTSDHVLDPDRSLTLKDQDELALAVAQGVFDPATASVSRPTPLRSRRSSPTGARRSATAGSTSVQIPTGRSQDCLLSVVEEARQRRRPSVGG